MHVSILDLIRFGLTISLTPTPHMKGSIKAFVWLLYDIYSVNNQNGLTFPSVSTCQNYQILTSVMWVNFKSILRPV